MEWKVNMESLLISNGENFIPNNNYDQPMINGEISPILGTYVEAPADDTTTQVAYAWIE